MIFFVLILLLIVFNGAKAAAPGTFVGDYISREKTNAVKGIFVVLVLFQHASQYMSLSGVYDKPFITMGNYLNQMIVVMFLFYSGYGIMESISKKKFDYVKSIAKKRFPSVFLNFAIAVCLFLIINYFLGKTFNIRTILLAFTGWTSVGNSNWYMFAIFVLYILTFFSFLLFRWYDRKPAGYIGAAVLTVLTMLFVLWEIRMGKPMWFYDTTIMFPLGCWYSLLKPAIEKVVMKNDYLYSFAGMLVLGIYCVAFHYRWNYGIEGYTVWAATFTLLVVLFTMKISLKNNILLWFGEHIFSVYILQRIPMIIFAHFGLAQTNEYTFLILSILCTILLALVFDYLTGKLSKRIFR